jgi:hypothetical protein
MATAPILCRPIVRVKQERGFYFAVGKQLKSWWNLCIQKSILMRSPETVPEDRAMVRTKTPDQDRQGRQLAEDIRLQSAEILQEVAELLAVVPDEELFGDNEFVVRQKVLQIVAAAYQARMEQKKMATTDRASTARTAAKPPASTGSASAAR